MGGFLDFFYHLDDWLQHLINMHPFIIYLIIFSFVFTESAFFPAAPFLPGDGLLFSIGVLAAGSSFNLWMVIPLLIIAGILGTKIAFELGKKTEFLLLKKFPSFNPEHIKQANEFYAKRGGMAFLFSRFMPVIRALVPLVAGIANMDNHKFWKFNIISVSIWVIFITLTGFELGHLPFVKQYFGWIILGVSAISLLSITMLGIHQQFWKKN